LFVFEFVLGRGAGC